MLHDQFDDENEGSINDFPEETELDLSILIESFVHKALDIEESAREFISLARKNYNANADRLKLELEDTTRIWKGQVFSL